MGILEFERCNNNKFMCAALCEHQQALTLHKAGRRNEGESQI